MPSVQRNQRGADPRSAGYAPAVESTWSVRGACMEFRLPQICQNDRAAVLTGAGLEERRPERMEQGELEKTRLPSRAREADIPSPRTNQGSRCRRLCGWCFLLTVFSLIVAAVWGGRELAQPVEKAVRSLIASLQGGGHGSAREHTEAGRKDGGTFACEAESAAESERWEIERKHYCCQQEAWGCPALYLCEAQSEEDRKAWSVNQKTWCCEMKSEGCPRAPTERTTPQPTTTTAEPTTTPEPTTEAPTTEPPRDQSFDCASDFDERATQWSREKLDWCCNGDWKTCAHKDQSVPPPPPMLFDCKAEGRWQEDHRKWCCQKVGVGCFECDQGKPIFWPYVKRSWCCAHGQGGEGCEDEAPAEPHDQEPARTTAAPTERTTSAPATTTYTGPQGGLSILVHSIANVFR